MPVPKSLTPEQQRLQDETSELANRLKAELPPTRGFVLITFDGPPGEGTTGKPEPGYMAWSSRRIDPQEMVRVLQEFLHAHQQSTGTFGEPSANTATAMREQVAWLLRDGQSPPNPHKAIEEFAAARKGKGTAVERSAAFLTMATMAMAEHEHLRRQQHVEPEGPDAAPARGFPPIAQVQRRMAELWDEVNAKPREWPPGDTKTTLVEDLLALPETDRRQALILEARKGTFHDYESSVPMPKVALIQALIAFGFEDLARKAMEGAYDHELATVVQTEELRHDVGAAVFDDLMGIDPSKRGKA